MHDMQDGRSSAPGVGFRFVATAVLLMCVGGAVSTADAAGYGASLKYANSSGRVEEVESTFDTERNGNGFELGFVLDTSVARNQFFNYRLVAAFEYGATEWGGDRSDMFGGSLTSSFGLGLWRRPSFRLYVGPDVRLAATYGSVERGDEVLFITQFDVAAGPMAGFNFHLGSVSLSATVAYYPQLTVAVTDRSQNNVFVGFTNRVMLGIAVLFRTSDDDPES